MSYAGRMYLRMFLPAGLALALGVGAAGVMQVVQDRPGELGNLALYSQLPRWLLGCGLMLAVALAAVQLVRLRLWDRGALASCYVCGCLLAAPRRARVGLGKVRPCTGCGKIHGVNHRVHTRVVPLAVAVAEPAPVRSVRSSP
jgi:hypothetical protein